MRRLTVLSAALCCGLLAAFAATQLPASPAAAAGSPVFSAVNPLTFDFVAVGTTSPAKSVTVTNVGTAALNVKQVALGGRDAKDFAIASDGCTGHSLAPQATCAVGIRFRPSKSGTRYANLRFTDNTPCSNWINIAGSGTDAQAPVDAHAATCEAAVQEALDNATTTVTNTNTVTTTTPAAVVGNSVIALPKAATCSSRRSVTVGLTAPNGKAFTTVKILLRGKVIKTLKGRQIKAKVSLKGLPRGRFTLEVRAQTADGKKYTRTHHYVTCVSSKS